jgi:hypothetical protein
MKYAFLFLSFLLGLAANADAQSWEEMTAEQKLMSAQAFRKDNQAFLASLGMNEEQRNDIDNVNLCFLSGLDRITRYAEKPSQAKKYAGKLFDAREKQLEAIMGKENRETYMQYIADKLVAALGE